MFFIASHEGSCIPSFCWTMLVFRVIACIVISGALGMEPGNVTRNQTVVGIQGTDVNLTCSNKTWRELFYVIWNITLSHGNCIINFNDDGQNQNTCNGGKALLNTSSGESYLLIPNVSLHDEGLYKCEVSYRRGGYIVNIHLILSVSPSVSAWLEWRGSRWVAVCVAGGGKPAASVRWRNAGNLTTPPATTMPDPDGYFTVTSTLELPEDVTMDNLTCVVDHPSWEKEHTKRPVASRDVFVLWVPLCICAVVVLVMLGTLYFGRKKLTAIRHCWQSDCMSSQEAVSPSTEDVEELEPYASYVQRVNSLYSSTADLLK